MCLVRRFWGDSAEQAKFCSTHPVRCKSTGNDQSDHPNWMRRSRKLTVPTSPVRSRKVRPDPIGRGAERGGRVVEKNCIMWVDTRYTICYNRVEGGPRRGDPGHNSKKLWKLGRITTKWL